MSKTAKIILIIAAILVVGTIAYFISNRPVGSCSYNGKVYNEGDSFKSSDNCNTCGCSEGKVACTLMYCDPVAK